MQTLQSEPHVEPAKRALAAAGCFGGLILLLTGCEATYRETYVSPPPAGPPPAVVYAPAPPPPPQVYQDPPQPPPPADAAVATIQTESDFYEPLSPYGEWVVAGSYGRCWRPSHVEAGWRPYCNGSWQRTDAGWYWVSVEPWAWATYHYGRWDWSVNLGWIWVPQTQWAPSWVAWREGAGYVGWAPLPPTATISISGGVVFRDAAFAPRAFVFVDERRMLEPVRPMTVIINNTTVINRTVNITRIQVVNKTVINDGPRTDVIERVSGRRIQAVGVRDLRHREEMAVIARHPSLQRHLQPATAVERTVPPPRGRAETPREAGVPPHPTPPVERTVDKTKAPLPPVTGIKPREKIDERNVSVKPPPPNANNPPRREQVQPVIKPTPDHRGIDQPAHVEKTPELKRETDQPVSVRKPPTEPDHKRSESQVQSSKDKPRGTGESKAKEDDRKAKKDETPETPR